MIAQDVEGGDQSAHGRGLMHPPARGIGTQRCAVAHDLLEDIRQSSGRLLGGLVALQVVESFGRIWLFTIAEKGWQAPGGQDVAEIGPLVIKAHEKYSVVFLEAVFTPGMTVPGHIHSGPEAWYTLAGETCLETPEGKQVGRAGGKNVIVPAGLPMHLTATGTENRRSLVLILHESAKPDTTWVPDWTPKGLCKN
jgi:quercetin dioxygenase-like cupin family protein